MLFFSSLTAHTSTNYGLLSNLQLLLLLSWLLLLLKLCLFLLLSLFIIDPVVFVLLPLLLFLL